MSDIDDCLQSVERFTRDRGEVMRAAEDKIAEIRARHDAVNNVLRGSSQMHDDRGYLLAEVERLTQEISEARAALKASSCAYPDCVDQGPDGKCTKWLLGKCDPTLEAKP